MTERILSWVLLIGGALLLDCHLWFGGLIAFALGVLVFAGEWKRKAGG